jgi:hypothetical protein
MNSEKFQCCFCGKTIESNNVDITALVVIPNWDKDMKDAPEQQLFCHMKCLREKVKKDVAIIGDIL